MTSRISKPNPSSNMVRLLVERVLSNIPRQMYSVIAARNSKANPTGRFCLSHVNNQAEERKG